MPRTVRMTTPTQAVLRVLVDDPGQERYGLELCAGSGFPSGTVHPILARLENVGWVVSDWEDIDPRREGRPRRRYYRLTESGVEAARTALAHAQTARTSLALRFRPAAGAT